MKMQAWACTALFCIFTCQVSALTAPPDLKLEIQFPRGYRIVLDPSQYAEQDLLTFDSLDDDTKSQFLAERRLKLASVLRYMKANITEPSYPQESEKNQKLARITRLFSLIDAKLFRTCKLLTANRADVGTWYALQFITYWGWLDRALGLAIEISVVRKIRDGKPKTILNLDFVKVKNSLLPIPIASFAGRVIRFAELDDIESRQLEIVHLPAGPVISVGEQHFGMGFAIGVSLPPPPFSSVSGFAGEVKRLPLWPCRWFLAGRK